MTNQQSIIQNLVNQLKNIKPTLPAEWEPTDHFKNVLGLDSLELVEFVARIEQHYRILVPDEDLEKMICLDAVVHYVDQKMALHENQ